MSTMKYRTRIGQNTGISRNENNVLASDAMTAAMTRFQAANSGSFLENGLHSASSLSLDGNTKLPLEST